MTIEEHTPLARYSSLHVGGDARYFIRVSQLDELRSALSWVSERELPWFILGGGTNFFCRDEGFPGLVVKMENRELSFLGNEMVADAGVILRVAILQAVQRGLRGAEHLGGIPGTVGGAVRGNAGSFGMETKDRLACVRVLRAGKSSWEEDVLPRAQLAFAYRDSTFKLEPSKHVIWQATFSLARGDVEEGKRLVDEDLAARKRKQPYEFPSVGSVFKNPSPVHPAGHVIEQAGLKGLRVGGAEVSSKHANFIVNRGGATATDALQLIETIKQRVFETSGIRLEEEIVVL